MPLIKYLLTLLVLLISTSACNAAFLDKEIVFSEAEIQAALAKSGPIHKNYGGIISLSLDEAPHISLTDTDGRARITARVDVTILNNPTIPINISGRAGIRYDDKSKAFFLENPVADSVESIALSKEMEPTVRQVVSQLMLTYFRTQPIYVLRENGSPEELTIRWLLKSVRIEPGKVIATLAPL